MRARAFGGGLSRSEAGRARRDSIFLFQRIIEDLFNIVSNITLKNDSKSCRCPKIVKPNLLGSQKYHQLVSIVRLQLAMTILGS